MGIQAGLLFVIASVIAVVQSQKVVIALVAPGIPRLMDHPKDDYDQVIDELSENGARQQYSLGIEFLARYPHLVTKDQGHPMAERIRVISQKSRNTIASSQCFARGLLSNTPGLELSSMDPSTWEPPYAPHRSGLGAHEWALPNGYALIPVQSFQMTKLFLIGDFDHYCHEVSNQAADNQRRFEQRTHESIIDPIAKQFGLDNVKDYDTLRHVYKYIETSIQTTGKIPAEYLQAATGNYADLKRAAMLSYLGSLDDIFIPVARLRTKDIYTAMDTITTQIRSDYFQNTTKLRIYQTRFTIFIYIMNMLNLTSRSCTENILRNKPVEGQRCENFPPFASSIIIEFHEDEQSSHAKENRWYVKTLYNGDEIKFCGQEYQESRGCPLKLFKEIMKSSLWAGNEDYYCEIAPGEMVSKKEEIYMLIWIFVAIFALLGSIAYFFCVKTQVKMAEIQLEYAKKQNLAHFAEIDFNSDNERSRDQNGTLL